jgi:hypothetical protein
MSVDAVEIKVSLAGTSVTAALDRLEVGATGDPQQRRLGFIEDTTVGSDLPLLHYGIVLRVREVDDDADDSTVKLRPSRRSQLTRDWIDKRDGAGWTLRIEEDWAGARHVLAVSCVSDLPNGRVDAVAGGREPLRRLFNEGQERFLSDCGSVPVNVDALTLLPLIDTSRWKHVRIGGIPDVVVERWTIDDLDFLELSIKADDKERARTEQQRLEGAVEALGLKRDNADRSKTERVLAHLVERVRNA